MPYSKISDDKYYANQYNISCYKKNKKKNLNESHKK